MNFFSTMFRINPVLLYDPPIILNFHFVNNQLLTGVQILLNYFDFSRSRVFLGLAGSSLWIISILFAKVNVLWIN